jgi:hypothetical protein
MRAPPCPHRWPERRFKVCQRQAMLAGVVITVLTVIGLMVSIPYWHMLGILAR